MSLKDVLDFGTLAPITGDELTFAMGVGHAAATGRTPGSALGHFAEKASAATAIDGLGRLSLTDIPANRAMMAVFKEFGSDKARAVMFRMWALTAVLDDPRLASLRRDASDEPGTMEVNEAVYAVAATMPLNKKGHFNAQKFCRRALAVAAQAATDG